MMSRLKSHPVIRFFSSLNVTVFGLVLWVVLIFIGTLSQVDMGIYFVKKRFFDSWFVYVSYRGIPIPVFPGGMLIGWLLLVNLVLAHWSRFKWTTDKIGIWLTHIGLIVLIFGGGLATLISQESQMAIPVGGTSFYTQSLDRTELAILEDSNATVKVTSIPEHRLIKPGTIESPQLPFSLRMVSYWPNAVVKMGKGVATQGIGRQVQLLGVPLNTQNVMANQPAVLVALFSGSKSLGTWLLSSGLGAPQTVAVNGRSYSLFLRPKRYYLPYGVTLDEFRHDVYPGTQIPKNFSSKVRVRDHGSTVDSSFLIFMNNPMRYQGKTFYQASFADNDRTSIFQVVDNRAWWLPYVASGLIFVGLLIHFGVQLWRFVRRRRTV